MPRGITSEDNYLSTNSLPVGADTGARATTEDFGGPQRAMVASGISDLGDKLVQGGAKIAEVDLLRKHMESNAWTSEQMVNARGDIDKFMADPKNYSDPNYANNLQKVMTDRRSDILKGAPSNIARLQMTEEFNSYQQERMNSAYHTQTQMGLERAQTSFINQFAGIIENYRTNRQNPNIDANADMLKNVNDMHQRIHEMFGKIAPQTEHDLRVELTTQAAYGVVDTSPELAEHILNSGVMEGRTRHFIQDIIDRAKDAHAAVGYQTLEDATKNTIAMAEAGKIMQGPPLSYYQKYLPAKEAEQYKMRVDDKIGIMTDYRSFANKVSSWNPRAQQDELQRLQEKIGTNPDTAYHDTEVFNMAQRQVAENVRQMHEDPTQYLVANNPTIRSAANAVRDDVAHDPGKLKNFVNLMLKYQGVQPHTDSEKDEKNWYLNLPLREQHILSNQQGDDLVKKIEGSTPHDAADMLHSVISQYPKEHQGIVFNDLVNRGLSGEMWAAESHRNASWLGDYVGSIQNAKEIRKDMTAKAQDFDKALDTSGSWITWSRVTAADNFQRQGIVDDMRSGILTYAMAMSQKNGMTPEGAIKLASERLINEGHETLHVNGAPIYLSKDSNKGLNADMGRRLTMLLSTVDPRQIKEEMWNGGPSMFPAAAMAGHEMMKYQYMRDTVTQRGEFKVNPDGTSVSLYLNGGEVRDKQNRAFTIQLKDVPMFMRSVPESYTQSTGPGMPYYQPAHQEFIHPQASYPLVTGGTRVVGRTTSQQSGSEMGIPIFSVPHDVVESTFSTNWPSGKFDMVQR